MLRFLVQTVWRPPEKQFSREIRSQQSLWLFWNCVCNRLILNSAHVSFELLWVPALKTTELIERSIRLTKPVSHRHATAAGHIFCTEVLLLHKVQWVTVLFEADRTVGCPPWTGWSEKTLKKLLESIQVQQVDVWQRRQHQVKRKMPSLRMSVSRFSFRLLESMGGGNTWNVCKTMIRQVVSQATH